MSELSFEQDGKHNFEFSNFENYPISVETLLEQWASTYSPTVLLGLDETSGTTAKDSSGNGNDADYGGNYTLDQSAARSEMDRGVDLNDDASTFGHVSWVGDWPAHSDPIDAIVPITPNGSDGASAPLFMLKNTGGGENIFDLSPVNFEGRNSGYTVSDGNEVLVGLRINASGDFVYFINGLPFYENTGNFLPATDGVSNARLGRNDIGSTGQHGQYDGFFFRSASSNLTYNEQHDIAIDAGYAPSAGHYYKETIIDDLGLATLGSQGDVAVHLPLWETAGGRAIDVSMYENHADFVNGPSLGQPPPPDAPGLLYSVQHNNDSGSGYEIAAPGFNFGQDSFTIAIWCKQSGGVNIQLWGQGSDSTALVEARQYDAGNIFQFRIKDNNSGGSAGTNVPYSQINDGNWHKIVCVRDATASELRLFVDGVKEDTTDISSLTVSDTSADDMIFGTNPADWTNTTGGWEGHTTGVLVLTTAVSDSDAAAL